MVQIWLTCCLLELIVTPNESAMPSPNLAAIHGPVPALSWSSQPTVPTLRGEVNNTDHLDAIQCSAGIPWLLEFMWMHFNTVCRRSTLPCSKRTPCWQLPLQQDKVHFCTKKKLPRNGRRIVTKSSRCPPGLQVPHIPIHSSICGTCLEKV